MQARKLVHEAGRTDWCLVFDIDDEVVGTLETFAADHGIGAARFTAVGAFRRATLAYYSWQSRDYSEIPVDQQVEVTALIGDIGVNEGEPAVHAHCVLGGPDGSAIAGHLLRGVVRPTLELFLTSWDTVLRREHDDESALPLIRLDAASDR